MLALTDSAVETVKRIVSSSDAATETGGLRLVADEQPTGVNFRVSVAELPEMDDAVVEEHGARVFLEPHAAALLDDQVLDVDAEQSFMIMAQR